VKIHVIIKLYCFLFISFSYSQNLTDSLFLKTYEYIEKNDSLKALSTILKAYDLEPNNQEILSLLGSVYLLNGMLTKSNYYLMKAIELDSTDIIANYSLAYIYIKKDSFNLAFNYLEKSFYHGYYDYDWLLEDSDLNKIRSNERFDSLLKKYFSSNDLKAISLYNEAMGFYNAKDYSRSVKKFLKAVKEEKKSEIIIPTLMAQCYQMAGKAYIELNKHKKAITNFDKAIVFWGKAGKPKDVAFCFRYLGLIYNDLEMFEECVSNYKKALGLSIILNDSWGIGQSSSFLGFVYKMNDDFKNSSRYYKMSFDYHYWEKEYDNVDKIEAMVVIAVNYIAEQNIDSSLYWTEKAFEIAVENNLVEEKEMISEVIGVPLSMVSPKKALPFLLTSMDYLENQNDPMLDGENGLNRLVIYFFIYKSYSAIGDLESSKEIINKSVFYIDGRKTNIPLANYLKAINYHLNDDYDLSMKYHKKVVKSTDPKDSWYSLVPLSLNEISIQYILEKDYENAIKYVEQALEISEQNNYEKSIFDSLIIYLLLASVLENRELYGKFLKLLVGHIESSTNISENYINEIFDSYLVYFEWLAIHYLGNGEIVEAVAVIESSKNRSFKETVGLNKEYYDFKSIIPNGEAIINIEEINSSSHSLYKFSSTKLTSDKIQELFKIEDEHDGTDIMFYFVQIDSTYYYAWNQKDKVLLDESIPSLNTLSKIYVQGMKYKMVSDYNNESYSKKLYKYLIKPISNQIIGMKKLIIVPDPILANIPFETLKDSIGRYLIETYEMSYVQSNTIYSFLQNREYISESDQLLAFGSPYYEQLDYNKISESDLTLFTELRSGSIKYGVRDIYGSLGYSTWTPLPWSLEEVNNLKEIFPENEIFINESANEFKLKSLSDSGELAKYNIIHFATHALVLPDLPNYTSLVLSQNKSKNNNDGFLTVEEISKLNFQADLVTLSACETGLGKVYAAEGVVGLTHAFITAGANGVIVSLWPVEDKSTSIFMTNFYSKVVAGDSFTLALAKTKREFIAGDYGEKYKHPYYWAPFVYYGK